ncbi:MAG: DUF429 domain-containing protein [Rhodoferax sp.]|nr:DUF429 domain-containing protein [Rhodoferax sp.]
MKSDTAPEEPGTVLLGCDFSSRPSARKPIVVAWGQHKGGRVVLDQQERLVTLEAFRACVAQPRRWIGGFDLPFGLPRALVESLGWPTVWRECIAHYASLDRSEIRARFAAFCDARPVGGKFAHRATDIPAGSSPSMKWVNPPVAYMLHAGVPCLLQAGVYLPGVMERPPVKTQPPQRIALESYPGLLAREIQGRRSYKSDDRAKQTPERLIARKDLVTALEFGQTQLGLHLKLTHAQRDAMVQDASGDLLDAALCLLQAAWAEQQHRGGHPLYGLPPNLDPLEGWIVSA